MKALVVVTTTPYTIDAGDSQALPVASQIVQVNTSTAKTIVLPDYSTLKNPQIKLTIVDITGQAATNNITIQVYDADTDTINGATSIVINTNNGSVEISGVSSNKWVANFSSTSGGGTDSEVFNYSFLTTGGIVSYRFNGTVTAWNPTGIDLRGKTLIELDYDGQVKGTAYTPPQWTFNSVSGDVTLAFDTFDNVCCNFLYK